MSETTPQPQSQPQPDPLPPTPPPPILVEPLPSAIPPALDARLALPPKKRNVLTLTLLFPLEYGLFIAVNLLDLLLTMVLIHYGGSEANPLAFGAIQWMGQTGLILFKIVMMFLVITLCEIIGRRQRLAARLVLWLGILLLLGVSAMTGMRIYQQLSTGM